jgi:molybdopterin-guanine dinucleotide biosynthesis protein B
MQPIISVVGRSEGGKTTLLERLIVELKRRGRKVAIIKHTHHDFEIDEIGKDSWRFSQAGGDVVTVSSPRRFAIFKQVEQDLGPQELARFMVGDYDLILTEGFMRSDTLKIEVHRKEIGGELLCSPQQLLAVITDEPLDVDVPQFSKDEAQKIVDLIENKVLVQPEGEDVELFINDTYVPIKLFVREFMARTLVGMVSALKGIKEVKSLSISLRRRD